MNVATCLFEFLYPLYFKTLNLGAHDMCYITQYFTDQLKKQKLVIIMNDIKLGNTLKH